MVVNLADLWDRQLEVYWQRCIRNWGYVVIFNQIEEERQWNFVIVQFATEDKVIFNQNRKGKVLKFSHCSA